MYKPIILITYKNCKADFSAELSQCHSEFFDLLNE